MKKTLTTLVLIAFLTTATGCTGSFNLTRKVYNLHRSQSDKWADELVFLIVTLIPVYSIATFADAIVFNSIEFWTGDNPIEMVNKEQQDLKMSYVPSTDQVVVAPNGKDQLVLERSAEMVLAKNDKGDVLFTSIKSDTGDVSVYNAKGKLVKTYSPEQMIAMKEKIARN